MTNHSAHRHRGKPLGTPELIAIALGGMIGGGIFTILGISVEMIGSLTPIAIIIGGALASLAAYSYVKLALYYKDEGATYSFFKRTFTDHPFAASLIGWFTIFGYISTLALYAYTFASYAISGSGISDSEWLRKGIAGCIIALFALVNIWSVKGMGKLEDIMVYSKLVILAIIAFVLINNSNTSLPELLPKTQDATLLTVLIVAAVTFVAFEGFQLVILAIKEIDQPEKKIPRAIYTSIALATLIYVVIALGTIMTIPFEDIIRDKEHALAAGATSAIGHWGTELVIAGALLATSSAISGTLFGASRLMSVIARDGYFPATFTKQNSHSPIHAIICLALLAFFLILVGGLQLILEFGSITFLIVSLLMAYANFKIRHKTESSLSLTLLAIAGLGIGTLLIFYFEFHNNPQQLLFIATIYVVLTVASWLYSKNRSTSR
jgi:amino acid transporter